MCYGQLRGDKSDDVRACYWKRKNLASQMTIYVKFHYRNSQAKIGSIKSKNYS